MWLVAVASLTHTVKPIVRTLSNRTVYPVTESFLAQE
jgi:hypothetical protein